MICGDFNLIYHDEDKNNGNLHRRKMGRFLRLINDLALKEVYLNGLHLSNEQSPPHPCAPGQSALYLRLGGYPRCLHPSMPSISNFGP